MNDQRRTIVAGLTAGVFVIVVAGVAQRPDWPDLAIAAVFVVAATCVMAWMRFGPRSLVLTWLAAVVAVGSCITVAGLAPDGVGGLALGVLAGLWFGSLAVAPWLLATVVLRHFLGSARPGTGSARVSDRDLEADCAPVPPVGSGPIREKRRP